MHSPILAPVVALVGWTLIVWIWMYATRLPAMARAGIDGTKIVGSTGPSLRADLVAGGETRASWVADNYNHLHEQPTAFYAICIVLALAGMGGGFNLQLAWAYVALRVVHSIVQIGFNRVLVRFSVFVLASLCLFALTLHAAMGMLNIHPLLK
ncbi:MAPEG family protein [Sphingomonas sp.]|uniref:MAPEG family protein n=1 Tax=Sphingomonas sp. TaxID=28214 RepID=UPI001DA62F9B|nr:MAPEG family protein [Sphingomonas sp.]MBX9796340.1 MAPEG family protein [Sphingomonas sp.]